MGLAIRLRSAAHHDLKPTRQHDPHVTRLPPVPEDMWTHVRGPPPSWLRHNPTHSQVTDVDLLDLDRLELECLVRPHQVLGSNLGHARGGLDEDPARPSLTQARKYAARS